MNAPGLGPDAAIDRLLGKRVYFDTNAIIYFVEHVEPYVGFVTRLLEMAATQELRAIASDLTLTEVLYRPYRDDHVELVQAYRELLLDPEIFTLVPASREVCVNAAELGGQLGLRPFDALHFASARAAECNVFVTNDLRFKSGLGVEVIRLDDTPR